MISHTYAKEENSKKENFFARSKKRFFHKMSLISYFAGERVIISRLFAFVCILITYIKFIGNTGYLNNYEGILGQVPGILINLFNETTFLIDKNNIYLILTALIFFYDFFYLITFTVVYFKIKNKDNSNFVLFLVGLFQLMGVINFWILYCFEIETAAIVLVNMSTSTLLQQLISYVNIISTVLSVLVYCYFGNKVEFNFEIGDHFSRLDTRGELHLLLAKTFFSANFIIKDSFGDSFNTKIYFAICIAISIYMLWYITSYSFYYYNFINLLLLFFNLATLYTAICSFILIFLPSFQDRGFIFIFGYLIIYPIAYYSNLIYCKKLLAKIPFVEIKDDLILCKYMSLLVYLVCEENIDETSKLKLVGLMKQHELNCVYEKMCICKSPEGVVLHVPKMEATYTKTNEKFGYQRHKVYFLHLVKNIFEFLIMVTRSNNVNLIMMFAYFMFFYFGNYYYSLFVLLNLKKNPNLTIQQITSLNRIFEMIHNKIHIINAGYVKRCRFDGAVTQFKVDFSNIIFFYEKVTSLKNSIYLSLEYSLSFWSCILNKAEIDIIKRNGLEFYKHHSKIEVTYKEIRKIFDKLSEINDFYHKYKAFAFGELNKSYLKREEPYEFNEKAYEKEKFFNPKSVILIANMTDKNKATIEKISENIKWFLGHNSSECLGQDVKLLMPNFYKMRHTGYIHNYFETGVNKICNKERPVYALHYNGYSLPTMLSVKMLPNYLNKVYFVGFLRESHVDYEFIITTTQGKIEMISKNVFDSIFGINNSNLFNTTDYFIHFICKEYIDEIEDILNNEDYQISDFRHDKKNNHVYKYAHLHFKNEVNIESILKDHKKNENTGNNLVEESKFYMAGPFFKIFEKREVIKESFSMNSLKRFTMMDNVDLCSGEILKIFKLYTSINDGLINLDELQMIEEYLELKDNGVNLRNEQNLVKVSSPMKLSLNCSPMKTTFTGMKDPIKHKSFNQVALVRGRDSIDVDGFGFDNFNLKSLNSQDSSLTIKTKMEFFQQYLSIKKRYTSKRPYGEMKHILILNLLFLIGILIVFAYNYIYKYNLIVSIFNAMISNYFVLPEIVLYTACIDKNFGVILNSNLGLEDLSAANKAKVMDEIDNCYDHFNNATNRIFTIGSAFSDTLLPNLERKITLVRENYSDMTCTIDQALNTFSSKFGVINDPSQIVLTNPDTNFVIKNLNDRFYNDLYNLLNGSLISTKSILTNIIATMQIDNLVIIVMIISLGIYIYARILCYYCKQNQMISLLLSIDDDTCREVIESIRRAKIELYQKEKRELEEKDDEEDNLKDDEEIESMQGKKLKKKRSGNKKGKKEEKKGGTSPSTRKSHHTRGSSTISTKMYFTLFAKIVIILSPTLIPFIFVTTNHFYENKSTKFIDMIFNINQNVFYFVNSFINFQKLVSTRENIIYRKNLVENYIHNMKENQFNTSNTLYDTLSGLNNTEDFKVFFTVGFCNFTTNVTECSMQDSPYANQGFLYVLNMNIDFIENMLRNTKILDPNKTDADIKAIYSSENYISADTTFNVIEQYGFEELDTFLKSSIATLVSSYETQFLIMLIFSLICLLLNQIISIWLMRHIVKIVNFELKNIFSLMPFIIVMTNNNIYQLLSK